jgi:fructose-1,6-bisphosphatase
VAQTVQDHQDAIDALNTELTTLRGKVDHSAMGRNFNFSARRRELREEIEWHQEEINKLTGGFEVETQGY